MERALANLGIEELHRRYRAGELTPSQVVEDALARAERTADLRAYLYLDAEGARDAARRADAEVARGEVGPLTGIPVAIKDLIDVAGMPTTHGSAALETRHPEHDSRVVARLRAAGAIITGKTNTSEFGQSATTENRLGEPCRNPWDATRTPGGSSGGSAVAVATGTATASIGSDGGGSVRVPAAMTGLVGLKVSHGGVVDDTPVPGLSAFSDPGVFAWDVADVEVVWRLVADDVGEPAAEGPLRVGFDPAPDDEPITDARAAAVRTAAERLAGLGHEVAEHRVDTSGWMSVFGPLALDEEYRERGHLLEVADRLTPYELATLRAGAEQDPARAQEAARRHPELRERLVANLDGLDLLVLPILALAPFPVGERPREIAGRKVGKVWGPFPFTPAWNVAGTPGVAVPVGLDDEGLPLAVQLVGRSGSEATLLATAEALLSASPLDLAAELAVRT